MKMSLVTVPVEILTEIVDYLNWSDISVLRRTCKYLNQILSAPSSTVCVDGENVNRILDSLSNLNDFFISTFIFRSVDFQFVHIDSFQSISHDINELRLIDCQVSEKMFVSIVNSCRSLEHLVIDDCASLFMSGTLLDTRSMDVPCTYRSIKYLEIINNRYLSDAIFNRLIDYIDVLVKLSVVNCPITIHNAIYRRFYPNDSYNRCEASESVLTFQNILKSIEKHSKSLKILDFSQSLIDDEALIMLSCVDGLNLEQIVLNSCQQLCKTGVACLVKTQSKLNRISFENCSKLIGQSLQSVCNLDVRKLNISGCSKLCDEDLAMFNQLKHLEELNVSANGRLVTSHGLNSTLVTSTMSQQLTFLNIASCSIDESTAVSIVSSLKQLRHLDMSNCVDGVTDVTVRAIISNLRWLHHLELLGCKYITDYGLTGRHYIIPTITTSSTIGELTTLNGYVAIPMETYSLRSLDDDDPISYEDRCNEENELSLRRLKGLRRLGLSGCVMLTDVSLKLAIKFNELSHLDLSLCQRITDNGCTAIAAFNPSITSLKVNQCKQLTHFSIVTLLHTLPRLKYLDIQGCIKVGSEVLDAAAECPSLQCLDVSFCPKVTVQAINAVEDKVKHIQLHQTNGYSNL
ncbi:hypothetical protein CHUAL_011573 [Chamberlinius hualienensis]